MLSVHGLLILQAANCNHQVPAKLFEYFRARKPVLGLTDPEGDTATLMREAGLHDIATLSDSAAIERALVRFLDQIRSGQSTAASEDAIIQSSRRGRSKQLAGVLDQVLAENAAPGSVS